MHREINSFGRLGLVSSSLIRGWAAIEGYEIVPEVVIYADGHELCRTKANAFRKDLLDNKLHPTGYCGFEIRNFNQQQLQNSKEIRGFILPTNKELKHSPLSIKRKMSDYKRLEYYPLVSIHIPKTAGTSFRIAAQRYFGERNVVKDYETNSPDTSQIILDTVYSGNKNFFVNDLVNKRIRFFTGHFNALKYLDILDANVKWCVFFRNPVQRVISEYKHRVKYENYKESLEYFYSLEKNCNIQHKCIRGLLLDDCFIGITEAYDKSIDLFNISEGYEFEKLKLNVNTSETDSLSFLEEHYKPIEENNALDVELYNDALKKFNQRLQDFNIDF
jgi:hypothetical protein